MSPQSIKSVPSGQGFNEPPSAMVYRLHDAGFKTLPVGRPDDPKAAAIKFTGKPISPAQTLHMCGKNGSGAYGVRLDGLVVVDFDENCPDQRDFVAHKFGHPVVSVATGRGVHFYYRKAPDFDYLGVSTVLNDAGVVADVKHGPNQYVIGPQSHRMDGVNYHPMEGDLGVDQLSAFIQPTEINTDHMRAAAEAKRVHEGTRHKALIKQARIAVWECETLAQLNDKLALYAFQHFEGGVTFDQREIAKAAAWAWDKRALGELYHPENPHDAYPRALKQRIGWEPDSLSLFMLIYDMHGHQGRHFYLNRDAMLKDGLTHLSRRRFVAAVNRLLDLNIIEVVREPISKVLTRTFRVVPCVGGSGGGSK